jgi:hypothetical protein
MRLRFCAFVFALLACFGAFGQESAHADPLSFFKNYFVTRDYLAGGAGLLGKGVSPGPDPRKRTDQTEGSATESGVEGSRVAPSMLAGMRAAVGTSVGSLSRLDGAIVCCGSVKIPSSGVAHFAQVDAPAGLLVLQCGHSMAAFNK